MNKKNYKHICNICNKIYANRNSLSTHNSKFHNLKIKKKNFNKFNSPINNHLIDLIVDKTKTIEELKNKIDINNNQNYNIIELNKDFTNIILNNIKIELKYDDAFINATQLCKAGNKIFNDWYLLKSTKDLIQIFNNKDIKYYKKDIWIHIDLAINLAYWISPFIGLEISKWIRNIYLEIIESKDKEIKLKNHRIKLLEDTYLKKHRRIDYPDKNVIYMLTTEDNKKKRIYIIGKAIDLKNRISTYNKTCEHEVIYYKSCHDENIMNIVETMIIEKLNKYKEQANRDRFILPIDKEISYFTDIINECINFFIKNKIFL